MLGKGLECFRCGASEIVAATVTEVRVSTDKVQGVLQVRFRLHSLLSAWNSAVTAVKIHQVGFDCKYLLCGMYSCDCKYLVHK